MRYDDNNSSYLCIHYKRHASFIVNTRLYRLTATSYLVKSYIFHGNFLFIQ